MNTIGKKKWPEFVIAAIGNRTGVEVKEHNGRYYGYQIKSIWDNKKKRPKKITEKFLGKITEAGLVKPKHERMMDSMKSMSVKEFGATQFMSQEAQDIIQNLKDTFPESWKELFAFGVFRFFFASAIKNVQHHYDASYISESVIDAKVSPKALSNLLHSVGKQRERIKLFLSKYMSCGGTVVVDLTHIFSRSDDVVSATLGHNSERDYTPQVNLFLVYSFEKMQPMFYRLLAGSVTDVKSLLLTIKESEAKDVILIGDKGFYSFDNVNELDTDKVKYIFPIKRNSSFIDYKPLQQAGKRELDGHFLFEKRVIWYYERINGSRRIITFLDDRLKTEEERDFLIRADEKKASMEEFHENEHKFGTISIITKTDLPPQKIFELLKSRIEIENVFDTFKNVLNADRSYMHDDFAMEGWMFVNFIALLLYYKLYNILLSKNMLSRYSPKDIVLHLSRVFKIRLGKDWLLSEVPKKSRIVIEKLGANIPIN